MEDYENRKRTGYLSTKEPNYQELIIEMVHKIDNQGYLRKIYSFIKVFYDE